ncbi:MAG: DUF3857 domain-containing protein [Bacteroidota bacterium]
MQKLVNGLLFILVSTALSAQVKDIDLSITNIPAELLEGAESVVRYHHTDYEVHSDRSATVKITKAVTLLSSEADENEIDVYYNDNIKISQFKATIYDAFGVKIRDAKKSEINDAMVIGNGQFYVDSRVKTVTLEHSTYPFTVVYEYSAKQSDFGLIWFPDFTPRTYNQSCQRAIYHASVPSGNTLLYDLFDLPEPTVSNADGTNTYHWELSNQAAIRYEPYGPARGQALPNAKIQLSTFKVDDYQGTFSSWQDFGAFINTLREDRIQLPPALKQEVQTVIAGAATPMEKIDALYRFMQERVRYVGVQLGIGGWQPFSAEYVERNRYGDCKALSNYMGALLAEVDIESFPVLVYSGDPYYVVKEQFPTSAFNHMILYVPSEDMYLECTSSYNPTGYLGEGTHNRQVLHITPQGGQLAKTPALAPSEHGHLRRQDITITADGKATLAIKTNFYGASQETLRGLYHYLTPEKQKEWLHEKDYLPDLSGSKYDFKVASDKPQAAIVYQTEIPRYARKMGKRLFVPLNRYYAQDYIPKAMTERNMPIHFDQSRFYVDTINLTLPDNYQLESKGKPNIDIEHEVGEYHAQLKVEGNAVTWTRTLKLVPAELPATAYEEFRDFFTQVSKADRRQLVLKVKPTR